MWVELFIIFHKHYIKDKREIGEKILVKSNIKKYQETLLNSDSILLKEMLALFSNRNKILDELIKIGDRGIDANISW